MPIAAQQWDWGGRMADELATRSEGRWKIGFEETDRYENRTGNAFGNDPDLFTGLVRTRFALSYRPEDWIKFSGMLQDCRAPWYGPDAPNSARDPADLQEAYIELRPGKQTGFWLSAGRRMLNYGEARLIGTPQWSNLSRTYDHFRAGWGTKRAHLEALMVSPVKVRIGDFNRPELGDRVWGTYDSFPDIWRKMLLETYLLRHDQNRPGGFTGGSKAAGTDHLAVNTLGMRLVGPMAGGLRYSIETAAQNGTVGPAHHRGAAWFSSLGRRWSVAGRPLEISAEYKYASGSRNPQDLTRDGTFDQLYPANHDKFGREDLLGWRNIHNLRSLTNYGVSKSFTLSFMYNQFWLASARDALYNGAGRPIARSAAGTAGSHVGQEADTFVTYTHGHFMLGAGYGYLAPGEFLRKASPGVGPTYVYLFHSYTL